MHLRRPQEHTFYIGITVLLGASYLIFPFVRHHHWFGVSQFWHLGPALSVLAALLVGLLVLETGRHPQTFDRLLTVAEDRARRPWLGYLLLGLGSFGIFFLLRNRFINPDGLAFTPKFLRDVPLRGAHVTHDEMWELYLHSRFWLLTHRLFGWSVPLSYQFMSSVAGAGFVVLLVAMARRLSGPRARLLVLAVISGGMMQLFFGDVENYSLTSALILAYLFTGWLATTGRISSFGPGLILAVAMTFHLLAGWLLPSLAYLILLDWRRGRRVMASLAGLAVPVIFGGTLVFFAHHGLPLRDFYYNSHALGHGGHLFWNFARPSPGYEAEMIDLLLLLFPGALMLLPLLIYRRIRREPGNMFLGLAAGFMLVFMFTWRADMGAYLDWNLYAPVAIPLSILCWYNFLRIDGLRYRRRIFAALVALAFLHTYTWIISNHFMNSPG